MPFSVFLIIPITALMSIVPSSVQVPGSDVVTYDGDRYKVSSRVYQQGDTTIEETVFEVDMELPENAVMEFDGDPNTISGLTAS